MPVFEDSNVLLSTSLKRPPATNALEIKKRNRNREIQ
jgi:hypothetical protein